MLPRGSHPGPGPPPDQPAGMETRSVPKSGSADSRPLAAVPSSLCEAGASPLEPQRLV